jgi:ribose 1,5-bisphosphokinase PhnN
VTAEPAPPPFRKQILDAVVPATARWFVATMRRLEEVEMSPTARWEVLRQRLEQLGREPQEAP